MGKYTEKKLKLKNKKIIDYANSPYRNDFLDIYLTSQCSFHLATNTGLQQVSEVFKIPTATLIVPVGHMPLFKEKTICLTKHHFFSKKINGAIKKKKLNLKEVFKLNSAFLNQGSQYHNNNITLKENTSREIKDLALDMITNINQNWKLNKKDKMIQNKFKKNFIKLYNQEVKNRYSSIYKEGKK